MSLPVTILAGGLATRLGSLTRYIPKALLYDKYSAVPEMQHIDYGLGALQETSCALRRTTPDEKVEVSSLRAGRFQNTLLANFVSMSEQGKRDLWIANVRPRPTPRTR